MPPTDLVTSLAGYGRDMLFCLTPLSKAALEALKSYELEPWSTEGLRLVCFLSLASCDLSSLS